MRDSPCISVGQDMTNRSLRARGSGVTEASYARSYVLAIMLGHHSDSGIPRPVVLEKRPEDSVGGWAKAMLRAISWHGRSYLVAPLEPPVHA